MLGQKSLSVAFNVCIKLKDDRTSTLISFADTKMQTHDLPTHIFGLGIAFLAGIFIPSINYFAQIVI